MHSVCVRCVFYMCVPYVISLCVFHVHPLCILSTFHMCSMCIPYVFHVHSICLLYTFHICSMCKNSQFSHFFFFVKMQNLYGKWNNPSLLNNYTVKNVIFYKKKKKLLKIQLICVLQCLCRLYQQFMSVNCIYFHQKKNLF